MSQTQPRDDACFVMQGEVHEAARFIYAFQHVEHQEDNEPLMINPSCGYGNEMMAINHSKTPQQANAKFVEFLHFGWPGVCVVASCDIAAGDEVLLDYGKHTEKLDSMDAQARRALIPSATMQPRPPVSCASTLHIWQIIDPVKELLRKDPHLNALRELLKGALLPEDEPESKVSASSSIEPFSKETGEKNNKKKRGNDEHNYTASVRMRC